MVSELSHLPPALKPAYTLGEPNQPILLYKGDADIIQGKFSVKGHGQVSQEWFPYPQISFDLNCNQSPDFNNIYAQLRILDNTEVTNLAKAIISIDQKSEFIQVSGRVREPIIKGSSQDLSYLIFHVANLDNFIGSKVALDQGRDDFSIVQRLILEADGWKITVDQIRSTQKHVRALKASGGYSVTHVGKLERESGEVFSVETGKLALEALSDFLSFVQGFRVSIILPVGYSLDDVVVWREWSPARKSSPWQNVFSWAWGLTARHIVTIFSDFWTWWHDWGDLAKRVIYWYTESNTQAGAIEGSCVLEEATLDLIAWNLYGEKFEERKNVFDSVSKRINYLLENKDIPKNIPEELSNLTGVTEALLSGISDQELREQLAQNGAYLFTQVRNHIIHSASRNRDIFKDISVSARVDAWNLGLWYIEIVLLRLFNYQGEYFFRLQKGVVNFGDLKPVPWAEETGTS